MDVTADVSAILKFVRQNLSKLRNKLKQPNGLRLFQDLVEAECPRGEMAELITPLIIQRAQGTIQENWLKKGLTDVLGGQQAKEKLEERSKVAALIPYTLSTFKDEDTNQMAAELFSRYNQKFDVGRSIALTRRDLYKAGVDVTQRPRELRVPKMPEQKPKPKQQEQQPQMLQDWEMKIGKAPYKTVIHNGWTILIGRSAQDNDVLSLEVANPQDFWLHAAEYPGSHVVVRNPEGLEDLPDDVLQEAGRLAVENSRAKGQAGVEVVVGLAGNLEKQEGSAPGQIELNDHKIVKVGASFKLAKPITIPSEIPAWVATQITKQMQQAHSSHDPLTCSVDIPSDAFAGQYPGFVPPVVIVEVTMLRTMDKAIVEDAGFYFSQNAIGLELSWLDEDEILNPPGFLLQDIRNSITHELAHAIELHYEGPKNFATQHEQHKVIGDEHIHEVKALSAEFCHDYARHLATQPDLPIEDYLRTTFTWRNIRRKNYPPYVYARILKDLAWVRDHQEIIKGRVAPKGGETQIISTLKKLSYVSHQPGHQNSKGEAAPWVIRQHETGKILSSHKTKAEAEEHLRQMHIHKGSLSSPLLRKKD